MHGGIWTLCIDLSGRDIRELTRHGFKAKAKCVSYLEESVEVARQEQLRYEYQHLDYQNTPHPNLSKWYNHPLPIQSTAIKRNLFKILVRCVLYV